MMGFGSLDYGGGSGGVGGGSSSSFSSTSNLSPLAPPFTIDSSHHKAKSKPYHLDQFSVEDPYAFSSYSSSHGNNWLHLHPPPPTSPLSDSFSNPILEFDSICPLGLASSSTSTNSNSNSSYSYGQQSKPYYFDAPSMGSLGGGTNNVMPTPSWSVSTTSNSFPHVQHSEKVANNFINEAGFDPYYPQTQYPSAGIGDKRSSPSIVIKKPDGSDIFTMPGVDVGGYSGLGFNPSWGGFWNKTGEWEEKGSRKEPEGSFGWMEKEVAGSSTNNSLLKEGSHTADGLIPCGEASGVWPGKSVDSLAGKYHIGQRDTNLLNAECSSISEEKARTSLCNMSRQSMSSSSTVSPGMTEMQYPEEPYRGWSQLSASNSSYSKCFSPLDSCIGDPTIFYPSTAFSVGSTTKSPTIGKSFSVSKKSSTSANVNAISRVGNVFDNSEDLAGYTSSISKIKDPLIQFSAEQKESVADISSINNGMGKTDPIFMNSSPIRKDIPSTHSPIVDNSWNHILNRKQEHLVNQFNFCGTSTLTPVDAPAANAAGAGDPVESSLETFDQFNPAVDSPCWKGAPASRYSPFTSKETGTPQLLVKDLAGCNGLKLQEPHVFTINENDIVGAPLEPENSVFNENAHAGGGNLSFSSPKASLKVINDNGVQFSFGSQEPIKECFLPGVSECSSRLKPFQMKQLTDEENKVTFPGQLASECRVADSPSSEVNATIEHAESFVEVSASSAKKSVPKVDTQLLISAMHNLSELLLASCSNGVDVLEEQDHEILQRITSNLHSCASMKVGLMRPPLESHYPQPVSSYCAKKGVAAGKSQVTKEEASVIQSQCDNQGALEGGMSSNLCIEKKDMSQDYVSQIGDTDFEKDNCMTQHIKKLLKENVDDEESLPKVQLYKNLWLEAEAALCSMKYNACLASMKIEMEKHTLQQEKAGKSINVEEQSSSKVSCDQNSLDILSPNIKESLISKISSQEANQNSTSQEEDVEASVMARLHILKDRSSTKISTEEASQWSTTTNQEEDDEALVMARLHILKCRVDSSSSMSLERKQPVGSVVDGANAEAAEKAPSPGGLSVRNVGMKTRPTQVVDMGFEGRSKLWPVTRDELEDGASNVKNIPNVPYQSANYTDEDELVLDQDVPERVMVKEFPVRLPDEPFLQSYKSDRFGKLLPAGGYESHSSSDWEHVLKDELTWQN